MQWLRATLLLAAMALTIAILCGGTACTGGIKMPSLGRPVPKDPGLWIDVGRGWEHPSASCQDRTAKFPDQMAQIALRTGPNTRMIKMAYVLSEQDLNDRPNIYYPKKDELGLYSFILEDYVVDVVNGQPVYKKLLICRLSPPFVPGVDKSGNEPVSKGYFYWEFTLPAPGAPQASQTGYYLWRVYNSVIVLYDLRSGAVATNGSR